jgi:hypothetical protein
MSTKIIHIRAELSTMLATDTSLLKIFINPDSIPSPKKKVATAPFACLDRADFGAILIWSDSFGRPFSLCDFGSVNNARFSLNAEQSFKSEPIFQIQKFSHWAFSWVHKDLILEEGKSDLLKSGRAI